MTAARSCWCGASDLVPFGPDYVRCRSCETLVSQKSLTDEELEVCDDTTDFYGKQYWLAHQRDELGLPDAYQRARSDLAERNLHWLSILLKYRSPPASVLEIGCAHGSFVALMRYAGYDASGTELSPWIVSYARRTFDVPVSVASIGTLALASQSLDAIVMFDVLEHLSKPEASLRKCLDFLKPDGILLIQTPRFERDMDFDRMMGASAPFLNVMVPHEHLYLLSEPAIEELLRRASLACFTYEAAMFAQYDMCIVASRSAPSARSREEIESGLLASSSGRFVTALLDLRERELALEAAWKASEADRAARLQVIQEQGAQLGRISTLEADIAYLKARVAAEEERLAKVHSQLNQLKSTKWYRMGVRLGLL
jgi:2-polyprenyl-3-methyl-5-hydroxy-6-metoxy-1,4-benzoquinol methylase